MPTQLSNVPLDLVVDFDFHDPSIQGDIHDRLSAIEAVSPVSYCPAHGGYWLATSYDAVQEVLRNWETFSSTAGAIPKGMAGKAIPLHFDPPEHTAYRQLINPFFAPGRMKALETEVRATANALIDTFIESGRCEFVSDFATPLPTLTFLSLVGWPLADADRFRDWTDGILVGKPGASEEDDKQHRLKMSEQVFAYFGEMLNDRRSTASVDDLTGILMRSKYEGERLLTDDELLRTLWLLMLGGLHTVRGVLALGMMQLTGHPIERQRLIDDPSLIPSAVEELLRLEAPVAPGRLVTKDVALEGVQLRKGDRIVAFTSAANRDESKFACPNDLDPVRSPNPQLAFGSGPHRCIGSNLARIELVVAFEEIHRRLPDYSIDADHPVDRHGGQVRGVNSLHLQFTPGSSNH